MNYTNITAIKTYKETRNGLFSFDVCLVTGVMFGFKLYIGKGGLKDFWSMRICIGPIDAVAMYETEF